MTTLRRYLAAEIAAASAFVMAALLMLFAFFDLLDQVSDLGRGSYRMKELAVHIVLLVPTHVYEVFPIAVLIGTLFALAQLVANSEYTVMRASGLSVGRITGALLTIGLFFAAITFVFGEFIGPPTEQFAQRLRSQAIAGIIAQEFRSGLWVKDGRNFVNVGEVTSDAHLKGVRIYEFDAGLRLRTFSIAEEGRFESNHTWVLSQVQQTHFEDTRSRVVRLPELEWASVLQPDLLAVLLVRPERMSAWSLYSYAQHLKENRQKALRYEIALWTKMMYPIAVLVMMVLALPFSFFQRRQGGVGGRIFTGIMLGLAFNTLNRLFGTLGVLYDWPAAAAAVSPTAIFLALAGIMLWRQERR